MNPAGRSGNNNQAQATATPVIPEISGASSSLSGESHYRYIIPLNQTPSYSLKVAARRPLSEHEVEKLTENVQGQLNIAAHQTQFLMGTTHSELGVVGVQVLSKNPPGAPSVPEGLEDMASLIDSQSKRLEHEIRQIMECLILDNRCDQTKYNSASFLIAGAQYIYWLENFVEHTNREGVKALKTYLLQLHAHYQQQLLQNHLSMVELLKACKVNEISGGRLSGDKYFTIFIIMATEWKTDALGLFEEISLTYADNLKKLLYAFDRPPIEIYAGRGMLTAALRETGVVMSDATDIKPPTQSWAESKVRKASAKQVVTALKGDPIYLMAQPEVDSLENVIHLKIPMCMLVSGAESYQEISPPRYVGEIAPTLKPLVESGQLTIMPLGIPGYTRNANFCGVWLMTANMKSEDTQAIRDKVPKEFLLDVDPTSTSPCRVTKATSGTTKMEDQAAEKKTKKKKKK